MRLIVFNNCECEISENWLIVSRLFHLDLTHLCFSGFVQLDLLLRFFPSTLIHKHTWTCSSGQQDCWINILGSPVERCYPQTTGSLCVFLGRAWIIIYMLRTHIHTHTHTHTHTQALAKSSTQERQKLHERGWGIMGITAVVFYLNTVNTAITPRNY